MTNSKETYQLNGNRPAPFFETGWPNLKNHPVSSDADWQAVMAVRQAAYEHAGLPIPLSDAHDHAPNSSLYLLNDGGEPAATVRVSLNKPGSSRHQSPFAELFPNEYQTHLGTEGYVEVTRLAVRHSDAIGDAHRLFAILQIASSMADLHACRYIVAPTRSDHTKFYFDMGFEPITGLYRYSNWPKPGVVLALDWRVHRQALRHHKRYQYMFQPEHRQEVAA